MLRRDMLELGIPCALSDSSKLRGGLVNVFFDDTVHEFEDFLQNLDRDTVLFCDGRLEQREIERQRIYGRILDILDVKYGINPTSFVKDRYSYIGGRDRFCGRFIFPSPIERLILHHLLFSNSTWVSAAELAAFCLSDISRVSSISSFVAELNKRTIECTPFKIILSKRNSGYRYIFKE